nr:MAG TPA: hypothetical protein [Caudoviricetes sp.]
MRREQRLFLLLRTFYIPLYERKIYLRRIRI